MKCFLIAVLCSATSANVEVSLSLEVDCDSNAIYLVARSDGSEVGVESLQVSLSWPTDTVFESTNLIPAGFLVGFIGPPGDDLTDGEAVWVWTRPVDSHLTIGSNGVDIARFDFTELPDHMSIDTINVSGIQTKVILVDSCATFCQNIWDENEKTIRPARHCSRPLFLEDTDFKKITLDLINPE